jgi:integrase
MPHAGHKRGQIIPRGKGTFLVRWYIARDSNGKRLYKSETVHGTKTRAQQVLTKRLNEMDTHDVVEVTKATLGDYLDEFIANRTDIAERTRDKQTYFSGQYIKPYLGTFKMKDLTRPMLRAWHQKLLEDVGLNGSTIELTHSLLRKALQQAVDDRQLRENVASRMSKPRQSQRKEEVVRPLTRKEVDRVLKVLREDESISLYALFLLLLTTGLRPNEALALKWTDVTDQGRLHVRRSKSLENRGEEILEFTSGKNFSAERSIVLPEETKRVLEEHRKAQKQERLESETYSNQGFIFTTKNGDPYLAGPVRVAWKRIQEKAKVKPPRRLYDTRHTFATLMLSSGANVKVVAECLGHQSIAVTLNTYAHVLPNQQEELAEGVSRVFFS